MPNFSLIRQNMVKGQILPENVTNPFVIDSFLNIPREYFVPHQLARIAYMDAHFPLYKDRVLLRPATLARLLEALNPHPSEKILYIAGGTGYGPALLGQMGIRVIALDSEDILTQETERLLRELKLTSVEVVLGPLDKGWVAESPYDKIIIEGSVDCIPETLITQLKEGGEIITLKVYEEGRNEGVKYIKRKKNLTMVSLFDAFAPRLEAFQKTKAFVF